MHLYKDCGDMPIRNFDIVYRTNDFKYLVVGYNGYDDIVVPKGANERWDAIKNEWIKLLDDSTIAYLYQLTLEIVYLQTRFNVSRELLKMIWERDDMNEETFEVYIEALRHWNYNWNKKNEKNVEVKRLLNQLKASQNKITLKIDELEKIKSENDNGDIESSLEKQAVALEQITGKNNIDLDTTSVKKWIEICKLGESINEARRKANAK